MVVNGSVQIPPLAADPNIGLIHPDQAVMGSAEVPQPALDQRSIGQDPAIEGGVVHRKAPLQEQLLDVTIAERVAQLPGDRLQDQRCPKVPALEVGFGPALQPLGKSVQDHGPPPKSEAHMRPASSRPGKCREFATGPWWGSQRRSSVVYGCPGRRRLTTRSPCRSKSSNLVRAGRLRLLFV